MSQSYKLPKCWLGKKMSILNDKEQAVDQVITEEMVNMDCVCMNEMQAFFCSEGHMTECHVGMSCEEAECSHHEREMDRYDDLLDEFEDTEDELFCSIHQCEKHLVDYDEESRYECPECQREAGEALGLI